MNSRRDKLIVGCCAVLAVGIFFFCISRYTRFENRKDKKAQITESTSSDAAVWEAIENGETVKINDKAQVTGDTIKELTEKASELVSYKYYYTNAEEYEKSRKWFGDCKVPFTTTNVIFKYSGVISVGVDLSEASYEVDEEAKIITAYMPALKVIGHEIDEDSFEYMEEKISAFTKISLKDYNDLRKNLEEKQEDKIEDSDNYKEFWQQARSNTETIISGFIHMTEATKEYTINYVWSE